MSTPFIFTLRAQVVAVRREANQRRLASTLYRTFTNDLEYANKLYHDAVHIDCYAERIEFVLRQALLGEHAANADRYGLEVVNARPTNSDSPPSPPLQ